MNWERFEQMVQDRALPGTLQQQASSAAQSIGSGAAGEDRFNAAHRVRAVKEEIDMESGSISTVGASIKQECTSVTQQQDTEGGGSSATGSANCGGGDKILAYDNVENYYLYDGTATVSIMRLRICIEDDVVVVEEGEGIQDAYLIGQRPGASNEVRMLVEKWKLDLGSDSGPGFFLKSGGCWVQAQKPKLAYRHVLNDCLTLAHFLHFVIRHPTASAEAAREHLVQHFEHFGEQPSIEKLSSIIPVIKRQVMAHMDLEKTTVLREFFPHHFNNLKTSFSQKLSIAKMNEVWERENEMWETESEPLHQNGFDITGEIFDEIEDKDPTSIRSNGTTKPKTPKQRRLSVQADLRILNTQWRNLIAGGTKVIDREKRPEQKKVQISRRKNSVQKKTFPPEIDSPHSKSIPKSKPGPKPKPGFKLKLKPKLRLSWEEDPELHPESHSSEPSSSGFCKFSPTKKRKKDPLEMLADMKEEEEEEVVVCPNFIPKISHLKVTKRKYVKQTSSGSGSVSASDGGGKRMRPRPMTISKQGVHSPSRSIFLEGLEEPPICTICDDGGDLICCDGPCRRHFHAMPEEKSCCKTLGLTVEQTMTPEYFCQNCLLEQHQCFICQELGTSAPSLLGPQEVYMSDALGCKKYYQADCVSKVLYPGRESTALAERIQRGLHGFLCPRHNCAVWNFRPTKNENQPTIKHKELLVKLQPIVQFVVSYRASLKETSSYAMGQRIFVLFSLLRSNSLGRSY